MDSEHREGDVRREGDRLRLHAIGRRVRGRRLELGLTQDQVRERSGLSKSFLSEIESGKRAASVLSCIRLAAALEVEVEWLLCGGEHDPADAVETHPRPGGFLVALQAETHAQADVVDCLRHLLQKAERGDLRAVGVVAQARMSGTSTAYALGDGDMAHLVCAIERLKTRLLSEE